VSPGALDTASTRRAPDTFAVVGDVLNGIVSINAVSGRPSVRAQ